MSDSEVVHVVAAALVDATGTVLVQRRARGAHQGGLWEFPGGKLEAGESRWPGLVRELSEELGIQALSGRPLIAVRHDYPDRRVLLDVWKLTSWCGEPRAQEGQPLKWVLPGELSTFALPAADEPVVRALCLPDCYVITPSPEPHRQAWLAALDRALAAAVPMIQLRATELDEQDYRDLAIEVLERARAAGAGTRVVLNADPRLALELGADGVHLNGRRLHTRRSRPLAQNFLIGASCHDGADLRQAARIGADFAVLGPVRATTSHPGAETLGFSGFGGLVATARVPVYALGGVGPDDLNEAWGAGGQGIAAIRGLWP